MPINKSPKPIAVNATFISDSVVARCQSRLMVKATSPPANMIFDREYKPQTINRIAYIAQSDAYISSGLSTSD